MLLNLKISGSAIEEHRGLVLQERLPAFIKSPCQVDYQYRLQKESDHYLLHLQVNGELTIICQRCLDEFSYHYTNSLDIALCHTDQVAERLMPDYECAVILNNGVDLCDLILDELHLYAPQSHLDHENCDPSTMAHLDRQNSTN